MSSLLAQRLDALRESLAEQGLDGFVIWRDDMFMGEEVRPCDERLAMISGFTGSAGYALILQDTAFVFSDGRYHLQMAQQLDETLWHWKDSTKGALADAIASHQGVGSSLRLGFDETTTCVTKAHDLPKQAGAISLSWEGLAYNPLDRLWDNRPDVVRGPAFVLSDEVTGQSAQDKLADLQKTLIASSQDGIIISGVDCVNWLCNIRGNDLKNTPYHLCFAYVPQHGQPILIAADYPDYETMSWQAFCAYLPDGSYSYDARTLPMALYNALQRDGINLRDEACPLYISKARKNDTELAGFREAHKTDAIALCQFWYWLEQCGDITSYHETELVAHLQAYRARHKSYLCDSFDTIMGAGPNGAIIHYRAEAGSDSKIINDNLLLIDSGAHYHNGTTDITRTFAIGRPDDDMIQAYSAVLASHIALAMARFPEGTNGVGLDAICRAPLWATGRDYAHGTGHGVGHMLSVHEGPAHISKRAGPALEAGMVLSNEPGFYAEGQWGIRLENLVAVMPQHDGFYGFESLTLVPFDRTLIDKSLLSNEACRWLDAYHGHVFEIIAPHLDEGIREWLFEKCAPLGAD